MEAQFKTDKVSVDAALAELLVKLAKVDIIDDSPRAYPHILVAG